MEAIQDIRAAENRAVWSLALGLSNFFICPLLCLLAWSYGASALQVLDRPDANSSCRSAAYVGRILGIIGTLLLLVPVGLIVMSAVAYLATAAPTP